MLGPQQLETQILPQNSFKPSMQNLQITSTIQGIIYTVYNNHICTVTKNKQWIVPRA